jgi:hypothetical protein
VVWRAALGSGSDGGRTGGSWWQVVAVVVVWGGGAGVGWRWWRAAAAVVACDGGGGGGGSGGVVSGGGGARAAIRWARCLGIAFWFYENFFCREQYSPLSARVTRASDVALGKEVFAGPAVPRALC